jgi:hypothetical protein
MSLFSKLDGDQVVLINDGVWKQADVYVRNGVLFAAMSGGFIRLMHDGATSKPKVRIDALVMDNKLYRGPHGQLGIEPLEGWQPLAKDKKQRLIGAG